MSRLNPCTLIFLIRDKSVLLALKRGGEAVDGTLLGSGGKIELGETPLECAVRETQEELGVTMIDSELVADVTFDNSQNAYGTITTGDVFICTKWEGEPRASDELENPTWYPISQLPLERMSPEKHLWVPRILNGEKIRAVFKYDASKNLADYTVIAVNSLA